MPVITPHAERMVSPQRPLGKRQSGNPVQFSRKIVPAFLLQQTVPLRAADVMNYPAAAGRGKGCCTLVAAITDGFCVQRDLRIGVQVAAKFCLFWASGCSILPSVLLLLEIPSFQCFSSHCQSYFYVAVGNGCVFYGRHIAWTLNFPHTICLIVIAL